MLGRGALGSTPWKMEEPFKLLVLSSPGPQTRLMRPHAEGVPPAESNCTERPPSAVKESKAKKREKPGPGHNYGLFRRRQRQWRSGG